MACRTSLALKNLTHSMGRLVVSMGGIGFAVVLMFMQLGFLGSVGETATVVLDRMTAAPMAFDLLIRSRNYLHVYDAGTIPSATVDWVATIPIVESATPIDIGVTQWQNPIDHSFRAIAIMGLELDNPGLYLPDVTAGQVAKLRPQGSVLVDDASSVDFCTPDGVAIGPTDKCQVTDVAGQQSQVVGTFEMGTGLAANGALLASRSTFQSLTPGRRPDQTSMALVRLESGVDPNEAVAAIRARLNHLGGEVKQAEVMTIAEAKKRERARWYRETPIGLIFSMGVALAVVVGGVISYLVLASDVQSHLSEYATLRAMGYSDRFLIATLLGQSTLLAVFAFPPAFLASLGLYRLTSYAASLPINMSWLWFGLVLLLTMVMCNVAGALALRRLLKAEPASLF
ncbi:MAG: ABC transporter permease [Planctomycetota bacterium]